MQVNIAEAKAQFSKLVELVHRGETVTIAKNNTPLVDMVPHHPQGRRKLGLLAGKWKVPEDFLTPDQEIESLFYGEPG